MNPALVERCDVDPAAAAERLSAARDGAARVDSRDILPPDRDGAFAIQSATVARLGPVAGWKVGAKGPLAEPACAPLPARHLFRSGAELKGSAWARRGVEVELALRVAHDIDSTRIALPTFDLFRAFDAVLPAVEVVESRLADWPEAPALAQLADLQSHGALVCGEAVAFDPQQIDLRQLRARLAFDGLVVAETLAGNPAADVWRLLGWLAAHCAARGSPLRAGDIVTTGSCTGMLFAPENALVEAHVDGLGDVSLRF